MTKQDIYRRLPAVDELLRAPELAGALDRFPRSVLLEAARTVLDQLREAINEADEVKLQGREFSIKKIAPLVAGVAEAANRPRLRSVINATGVVLHTNLGRAVLAEAAARAVYETATAYSNLELDLESGERGNRHDHVVEILRTLTGAEAAAVVNNNAAAVLLSLKALAASREVIISRGELIEIGGSFRIPEVMTESGAVLREVGTTNKTHLRDYEQAIGENTALLLKVHTSNYRVVGFVAEVGVDELAALGREHGIPVMVDLGSGVFYDLSAYGLSAEPTVAGTVAAGADLVTFSGDKLLGGPQAGVIVGKKGLIDVIIKDPLARALRIDKLSLAGLEATLRLSLDRKRPESIPALAGILTSIEILKGRAEALYRRLKEAKLKVEVKIIEDSSKVGGGALPLDELPTYALALSSDEIPASKLATKLRTGEPPVIPRVQNDFVLLDVRTITDEQLPLVVKAITGCLED